MTINTKPELRRKVREMLSEQSVAVNYEDVMKAFFDSSSNKEVSYQVIEMVKKTLGDSYVKLIFSNKDNPEELTKLIGNVVRTLGGSTVNVPEVSKKEVEPEKPVEVPSAEGTPEAQTQASNTSDIGISVNTPNE